jgi:hypothetical protein
MAASPEWLRITAALDAVSQQRNSYLSGLYWYTDLEQAQRVSAQSGKPILSLRLLGKLTDELSCANSRFFRTVLYSNAAVSAILRDQFVLHWQMVRPVPLITIDFGDGRKLERTITGNSIHYVLDSDGKVIDAFPGVYGPQAFSRVLAERRPCSQTSREKMRRRNATPCSSTTVHVQTRSLSHGWLTSQRSAAKDRRVFLSR